MKDKTKNNPLRSNTRFYHIWENMKKRCNNVNHNRYKNYGGRGIKYDPSWEKFLNFANDMFSTYEESLQLDRINNNGNYSKENCRWITPREQHNNRSDNRFIDFMGILDTISNWERFFGFNRKLVWQRIYRSGWTIEQALTERNPYYGRSRK